MRIVGYFLGGAVLGAALALGLWWSSPETLRADRPVASPAASAAASNVVPEQIYSSRQNAITRAVKEVSPAVVGINVISVREFRSSHPFADDPFFRQFFPERVWRQKVENLGSGFIISPDGYVLTNEHVVHGAEKIVVTMTDGSKHDAQIIGYDYDSDVGLLKIDGSGLPYIRFGDSDDAIAGEWSIALGNPFGLFAIHSQPTVTVGVVSATDRDFDRNENGRLYQDMIQTDAAINRGNSGGPLVNSSGELIGMNTLIFTETGGSIGLGFAIPSNRLAMLYEDLKLRGDIDREFWIGLEIQNVNRLIAISLRLPEIRGVVVTEVESGSPAARAGVEVADAIVTINGQRVDDAQAVQNVIRNSDLRVGDTLSLQIFSGGELVEKKIKLGKKH